MVQINFAKRTVTMKLVYEGPAGAGKATILDFLDEHFRTQPRRGWLGSIATEGDRTLFCDVEDPAASPIGGMAVKAQAYTVSGQVYYNASKVLALQGADGVVFVADSAPDRLDDNRAALQQLRENCRAQGVAEVPLVFVWNKRDLPDALPVDLLERELNPEGAPSPRALHTAVWTITEMIVVGGWDENGAIEGGARYFPNEDVWMELPLGMGARGGHSAVWASREVLIWGGSPAPNEFLNTGARYTPTR